VKSISSFGGSQTLRSLIIGSMYLKDTFPLQKIRGALGGGMNFLMHFRCAIEARPKGGARTPSVANARATATINVNLSCMQVKCILGWGRSFHKKGHENQGPKPRAKGKSTLLAHKM